ncbi:YhcN/YlaJ family sporulation lipoprotein [Brevibacillus massiliensis]|uniref:YhcN/YlaJ family sporulation lipoprotein n=1 Tax=Brevibacillus massiliensis TaxID=1118054 RepID=UPI000307F8E8|nr:YhcN/YlaJ family sporulation lipoprotein [Brevibacillus massiliensis]
MKKLIVPLACLALVTLLPACGTNRAAGPNPGARTQGTYPGTYTQQSAVNRGDYIPFEYHRSNNATGIPYHNTGIIADGNPGTPYTSQSATGHRFSFNQNLADRMVTAAQNVPGVTKATALVRGSDAIIGIRTRMADVRQRNVIERQVYNAARAIAPSHNIHVTSDIGMITRIDGLNHNLRNYGITSGPTTVTSNLSNAVTDFGYLLRDLGRTVTAPFR